MFFKTFFLALVLGILLAAFLSFGFRRIGPGPGKGFLFFATIIFLFTWGIGAWISPLGPVHFGISWPGFLFAALIIMLLLGALTPPSRTPDKLEHRTLSDEELFEEPASAYPMGIGFGLFFWIMAITLLALSVINLFHTG